MSITVSTDLSSSTGKVRVAAGSANARKRAKGEIVLATVEGQQVLTFVPDDPAAFTAVQSADS